jgi:hypothetical protein
VWVQQFNSSICREIFDYSDLRFWGPISDELAFITEIVSRYPHIFMEKNQIYSINSHYCGEINCNKKVLSLQKRVYVYIKSLSALEEIYEQYTKLVQYFAITDKLFLNEITTVLLDKLVIHI